MEKVQPFGPWPAPKRLGRQVTGGVVFVVVELDRELEPGHGPYALTEPENLHGSLEGPLSASVDHEVLAVLALEEVGNDSGPAEPLLGSRPSEVGDVALVPPPVHRALGDDAVEQRDVDVLAMAADAPGSQGGQYA